MAPAFGEEGTVVQARAGANPLFLWDATAAVTAIVEKKQPREMALRELEVRALQILSARAMSVKSAKALTIRVIYQKTGAVSPIYGSATFEGVERLFELTVAPDPLRTQEKTMAQTINASKVPSGMRLVVTGELPPI
jgi:hypothetical protein